MGRWKKRMEGAISIFLVIILISNYALIGVLVDSGRQRMARASAEMALDTAASSILAYYDQMIYDLYGLFATDSLTEKEILNKLTTYVEKTLGTTKIEKSEAKRLTDAIVGSIFEQGEDGVNAELFDGYHFKIDKITLNNEELASLANTDVVEAQIIDHMKYRAPKALADESTQFLENLRALLEVQDRIKETREKLETTEDIKKDLAKRGKTLQEQINAYNKKVVAFSAWGIDNSYLVEQKNYEALYEMLMAAQEPYDPWVTIDTMDNEFDRISNKYEPVNMDNEIDEAQLASMRKELEDEYKEFLRDWGDITDAASKLYEEAQILRESADALFNDYQSYVELMQQKMDSDPSNENLKTLYGPEIELAEATCGEVLKNMGLVLAGRQYLLSISTAFLDNQTGFTGFSSNFIEGAVNKIIDVRMGASSDSQYGYVHSYISKGTGVFAQEAKTSMDILKRDFEELFKAAKAFEPEKEVTLNTGDTSAKSNLKEEQEEKDKPKLRDLDPDAVAVAFVHQGEGNDMGCEMETDMSTNNTIALLNAGTRLLEGITKVLEDARDSLYIDEYIIAYFPNYVQQYRLKPDSYLAGKASGYLPNLDSSYYKPFNATQAEVEYILSGNVDTSSSVLSVSAKLTGVRMIFNTIAIFTDTGKVSQANSLAAAISGPLAPAIATALLVAWAIAESVWDTDELLNGNKVMVFKQGKDWHFSLENGTKEIIKRISQHIAKGIQDKLEDEVDNIGNMVSNMANRAVYEAYERAGESTDAALSTAKGTINTWLTNMQATGSEEEIAASDAQIATNELSAVVESSFGNVESIAASKLEDAKDQALAEVNSTIKRTEKELKNKAKELVNRYSDQFAAWAISHASKYFELGNSTSSGGGTGKAPEMSYVDYIRIFLLFYDNQTKVERIQQLIQANVRYGSNRKGFSMSGEYTCISAKLTGSISFMFMSNAILPDSLKENGRMKVAVSTRLSY